MHKPHIAILIYTNAGFYRNALTEEKYKHLADAFICHGFNVSSVSYNDASADRLAVELLEFDAVLVWVNPIEQGGDRKLLDTMLAEVYNKGCFVSTHPEVILKMGTKDVLYKTRHMSWSTDIKMYSSYDDFVNRFSHSLQESGKRVLKQYRGNGGNGVFRISSSGNDVNVIHAGGSKEEKALSWDEFNREFRPFFSDNGLLIDQAWNEHTINGMVRCYSSGTKTAGFGYQEINTLYELNNKQKGVHFPPSTRYYYTENCGIFRDLREMMENEWIPELQKSLSITDDMMPVIWDADFFINDCNAGSASGKYELCEINVSCVSPFPPSAVRFIVDEVRSRIGKNYRSHETLDP